MGGVERLLDELLIEPWRIPVIVAPAAGINLGFTLPATFFGSRALRAMTASDTLRRATGWGRGAERDPGIVTGRPPAGEDGPVNWCQSAELSGPGDR